MTVAPNQIRPQNGVSRDVQDELARQHAEKRRRGANVSPVQYHKDLMLGDDWTCRLFKMVYYRLTMNEFAEPPETALDLGCGTGLWAIEAAKSWPNSEIIGLDLRDVQPDLTQVNLGFEYRDLAKRVQWVHADFLDPLPFESNHFDLVRICCIGLEVPEDSWQELLEECSRVLKPGGTLEVIEEDLLFPAGRTRKHDAERSPNLHTVSIRRQSGERNRSNSTASDITTITNQTQSSASTSSMVFTTERTSNSISIDSILSSSSSSHTDSTHHHFAQDHAKLKRAWEEMLGQRFLTHKILTVLPFYVSSFFSQVLVQPTMRVILPPPSWHEDVRRLADDQAPLGGEMHKRWLEEMRGSLVQLNGGDPTARKAHSAMLRAAQPPSATVSKWNKLHLARQVRLINACKEAMWQAYRKVEDEDERGGHSTRSDAPRDELRDEFERDWEAWEMDMKDRMGFRSEMEGLDWKDPDGDGLRPGSFRSSLAHNKKGRVSFPVPAQREIDLDALCRAVRGLTARKPANASA